MVKPTPEDTLAPSFSEAKSSKPTKSSDPDGSTTPVDTNLKSLKSQKLGAWKRFRGFYWRKKPIMIPVTIVIIAGILFLIPYTRYTVLGQFISRSYVVTVQDAVSRKPVSNAIVQISGVSTKTDAKGIATLTTKVGNKQVSVTKKYYAAQSSQTLVGLMVKNNHRTIGLKATGRQVPVVIINKLTGKPVSGALLTAAGTESKTDKDGKAIVVLPADKTSVDAAVSLKGYNRLSSTIKVTEQADSANSFTVTPVGKIYFLSRLSGKIDVVKTNLDGSDRQTVLAGTGSENQTDTIMLASRDWKYLALKSKRDGGTNAKLFMIDASTDKATTFDEGNAEFTMVGWSGGHFVYTVSRNGYQNWQPKAQALKSYDAPSAKLTTIDETDAEGSGQNDYKYNGYGTVYILNDELVYYKNWYAAYYGSNLSGKTLSLMSVKSDGSNKRSVKDIAITDQTSYFTLNTRLFQPDGIYAQIPAQGGDSKPSYVQYASGKVATPQYLDDEQFNQPYPTYLLSPGGQKTFWSESRDGANSLFIGDSNAKNQKQITQLSKYDTYGWYSDDYLLVSESGSQLFVLSPDGLRVTKISDYHKPDFNFRGYGGGYGGL